MARLAFSATVWHVWQERNRRVFHQQSLQKKNCDIQKTLWRYNADFENVPPEGGEWSKNKEILSTWGV